MTLLKKYYPNFPHPSSQMHSKNMYKKKIRKDELIGKHVKIKKCYDPTWTGRSGVIIDETKNMFLIEFEKNQKKIAKKIAEFEFNIDNKKIMLTGSKITYKCEDRIKKVK